MSKNNKLHKKETLYMNNFIVKPNGKRYYTQNEYLRSLFGTKVIKLSLNAGMNCPNRDGSKGYGGCIYCSPMLSGDFSGDIHSSLISQMKQQTELLSAKWKSSVYIAYFQAGTNTYAPLSVLIPMYEEALSFPGTAGITIATRADCITDEILSYLTQLSEKTFLTVELGLQTVHDTTAELINRCHTYEEFLAAYTRLKNAGINVCVHIINGLPGETKEMMLETAKTVSCLSPAGVKIHMLHIVKGTALADMYAKEPFHLLTKEEYTELVCDQIEIMSPDIVIERVTGDGSKDTLIAPLWTCDKRSVLNGIDKELKRRNTFQGIRN